jgi:hypothetical protein
MKILKSSLLLLFFLAFATQISAQATLSVQGTLQKSNGSAVDDGNYSLTFSIYTAATGGTALWTETQPSVAIVDGVYSVLLGTVTPLTVPFNQAYYVGVTVQGGTELIPRTLLTSSPYALSLIGSTNIFPSSGPIGAGTTTPNTSYQLHLNNANGDGQGLVQGTTGAFWRFQKGSNPTAYIGFNSTNNDFTLNPGAENIALQYNGTNKMVVYADGVVAPGKFAVGQATVDGTYTMLVNGTSNVSGNANVGGALTITGSTSLSVGAYGYLNSAGNTGTSAATPNDYSVNATARIKAAEFNAFSDQRIKKDFRLSDRASDLSTLLKLRVTDYRHIDEVNKGAAFKKGFIAQEVEQVFSEAVYIAPDFIPDVYALSTGVNSRDGNMTISLGKNHGFVVGDEVKLILEKGVKEVIVTTVPSETSFVVALDVPATEKAFVYGKKVQDFRAVDYDRIHTLNVSATQELARQVEQLKLDLSAAKEENAALRQQNEGLRSDLNGIESRLLKLENGATGTAQK